MLTLSFASGWVGRGRRIGPTAQASWTRKRTVRGAERCFFRRVGGTSASQRMRCAHTKSVPPAKKGLSDPVLDQRGPVAGQLLALHCCPSRLGHGAKSGFLKPGIGAQASTPKAVYFTACRFLLRNWVTCAKPRCDCSSCSKCPRLGSNTVWASAKTPA